MKEKIQTQGGRLDILLMDPADDSMYEVEVQLGETDPSHIIRTIEYWDNEKRRWPNRSHTAVLVAEKITSRFFNVVQLLSKAVPIIGIQANIVQVGEAKALHFTTIIDSFQEEEVEEEYLQTDESYWRGNYPVALECSRWYRDLVDRHAPDSTAMKFGKTVITTYVHGVVRIAVYPRRNDRALVIVEKFDEAELSMAENKLNEDDVPYTRKTDSLRFNVTMELLKEKLEVHDRIAHILANSRAG